jgi:hypothetical protein
LNPTQEFVAGCWAFFNGAADPSTRAIWADSGKVSDGDLSRLENFFLERGAQPKVLIGDVSSSADLVSRLINRGYEYGETLCTWWKALPAPETPVLVQGISVVEVHPEGVEAWARTVATGFQETDGSCGDEIGSHEVRSYAVRALRENCQSYLALIEGEPTGGAVLEIVNGIALVRTASTRYAQRRKGVQAALISARLRAASRAGCTIAFSMANKGSGSERNLRRFGFQLLQEGCTLSRP